MYEPAYPWRGAPMCERVRTIAPDYDAGDRVALKYCPDPGTVRECALLRGRVCYQVAWDAFPDDAAWYEQDELEVYEPGRGRGWVPGSPARTRRRR